MASKTAFDASRISAFGFDPDDLVLIEDPKHPLYDARIKLPLKPEFVANIKALGVTVPVVVRKIDGRPVVIDGRQRVRAAIEANPRALATFRTLGRQNLFGLAFRVNSMKTPAGRVKKIAALVAMLERGETIVPEKQR